MKYTLNGSTVVLNKDILSEESLNTMIKEIDSSYESCSKAIEAYNLVSNIKVMESFGYKATEGLGESITNGAKVVWEKIKEFFKRISLFTNKLITDFIVKIQISKVNNKLDVSYDSVKQILLESSKHVYAASNKIFKMLDTDNVKSDNSKIKMYQDLEKNTYTLSKVIRSCAKLLAVFANYQKHYIDACITNKFLDYNYESDVGPWLNKALDSTYQIRELCKELNLHCEDENYVHASLFIRHNPTSDLEIIENIISEIKDKTKFIIEKANLNKNNLNKK